MSEVAEISQTVEISENFKILANLWKFWNFGIDALSTLAYVNEVSQNIGEMKPFSKLYPS